MEKNPPDLSLGGDCSVGDSFLDEVSNLSADNTLTEVLGNLWPSVSAANSNYNSEPFSSEWPSSDLPPLVAVTTSTLVLTTTSAARANNSAPCFTNANMSCIVDEQSKTNLVDKTLSSKMDSSGSARDMTIAQNAELLVNADVGQNKSVGAPVSSSTEGTVLLSTIPERTFDVTKPMEMDRSINLTNKSNTVRSEDCVSTSFTTAAIAADGKTILSSTASDTSTDAAKPEPAQSMINLTIANGAIVVKSDASVTASDTQLGISTVSSSNCVTSSITLGSISSKAETIVPDKQHTPTTIAPMPPPLIITPMGLMSQTATAMSTGSAAGYNNTPISTSMPFTAHITTPIVSPTVMPMVTPIRPVVISPLPQQMACIPASSILTPPTTILSPLGLVSRHNAPAANQLTGIVARLPLKKAPSLFPILTPSNLVPLSSAKPTKSVPATSGKPSVKCDAGKTAITAGKTDGEFDPVKAMEWKDGIGRLPGSDLKFKLNEFGVIEMVEEKEDEEEAQNPELECNEKLDGPVVFSDTVAKITASKTLEQQQRNSTDQSVRRRDKEEPMVLDFNQIDTSICRCENCGTHGLTSEFCAGGRFCSKSCVGSFASKRTAIRGKKKRHTLSSDDRPSKVPCNMVEDAVYPPAESTLPSSPPPAPTVNGGDGTNAKKPMAKKSRSFSWAKYLERENAIDAPTKLFKQPFPTNKNGFRIGMKLEGIDPRHRSLYCVLTVAEIKGYRMRLHFDGYSDCYDFWLNADSHFIFPAGWAEKNGKVLQPPKGYTHDDFNWTSYLKSTMAIAAPKVIFTNTQATSVTPHGFRVGLKLEAVDKTNTALTCVATVADVLVDNVLVHFDGWEDAYDYWCDPYSCHIHPVGWCQLSGKPLSPPNDWKDIAGFTWEEYLSKTKSQPVPARAFKARAAYAFEPRMKLEAVDQRNPQLIRIATIVQQYSHSVKLHFDGWSSIYNMWLDDDSPDLHPAGWCAKTGHPLTLPILPHKQNNLSGGCPTPGCSGIGHIKGAKYTGHHSAFGCPYSQVNLSKENVLQDRLGPTRAEPCEAPSKMTRGSVSVDWLHGYTQRKCSTAGCEGEGHVSGRYAFHNKASSCPLRLERSVSCPGANNTTAVTGAVLPDGVVAKPLFGPGSGRGRKKSKVLKLIQKQKEAQSKMEAIQTNNTKPEPTSPTVDGTDNSSLQTGIQQSVFMSCMLTTPSTRDLPACWQQHSTKVLTGAANQSAADVAEWTRQQVAAFIGSLPGCHTLASIFDEQQIDGEAFLLLTQADIVKVLNIKLGPALKIFNSILTFRNNA